VAVLGEPAARELLDAITRSDADRAALIGRLYTRSDTEWLAELLMDLEGKRASQRGSTSLSGFERRRRLGLSEHHESEARLPSIRFTSAAYCLAHSLNCGAGWSAHALSISAMRSTASDTRSGRHV